MARSADTAGCFRSEVLLVRSSQQSSRLRVAGRRRPPGRDLDSWQGSPIVCDEAPRDGTQRLIGPVVREVDHVRSLVCCLVLVSRAHFRAAGGVPGGGRPHVERTREQGWCRHSATAAFIAGRILAEDAGALGERVRLQRCTRWQLC